MNPSGEPITPRGRGRGLWKQHPESHKELRRPQSESRVGVAGNNATAAVSERSTEDDISKTSNLSANAKEFYPKGYQQVSQNQDCCNSSQFEENQLQGGGDGQTHSAAKTNNDRITTSHLIDVMHHLTLNPGRFDALINPMTDSFRAWLADKDKIHFIVNAIVEQSIDEPNFRYNGARLCSFLNNEFATTQKSSFRNCLLTRSREEHTRMTNHIHTDPKRLHGFVMFMAELFMQLEVTKGCGMRITVLGNGLIEALDLLLTYPLAENIKCACQVLKLTGSQLDAQDPMNMNRIMQRLLHVSTTMQVEPSSCRLINSVLELRQSRWGEATAMSSNSSTNQSFNSYPQQDGPVFYGPDGQIMTPEESQFLQESAAKIPDTEDYDEYGDENWEGDNEMDEEIEAAYEQFLMGKNQAQNADKSNG